MSEGGLGAPMRHPIDWKNPDYYDPEKLAQEERRVFDVCHSCRRCFNLCNAFPRLFDLIDDSETGELDSVPDSAFQQVADACTLCDMCFMTKCPYVPPHEFDIDFPHLMLRHRAVEEHQGKHGFADHALTETDRNGRLAGTFEPLANWANKRGNQLTRPVMERIMKVHRDAELPRFHRKTFVDRAAEHTPKVNTEAPAAGRKAVLYATCFSNYNNPGIGDATRAVLAHNGVTTEVAYPGCCGMPKFEQGDLQGVADAAKHTADELGRWIDQGYKVIALVPSCALMLKFEWPLIIDDPAVQKLAENTMDISEYVVDIAANEGLAEGLQPLEGGISLHLACHARAQNIGAKASDMLRQIPNVDLEVQARCSGHGGAWGVKKDNFEVAMKVGRPVARKIANAGKTHLASECPLAGTHIIQGLERQSDDGTPAHSQARHPIELMAQSYGLEY